MSLTSLSDLKDPMLRGKELAIKTLADEIEKLQKEKKEVTEEIKHSSKTLSNLRTEIDKVKKKAVKDAETTVDDLEKHIKKEEAKVKKKRTNLKKKTEQIKENFSLLEEISDYLYKFAVVVEAEKLLTDRRGGVLVKRGRDIAKLEKKAEKTVIRAGEKLKKAKLVEDDIDGRYEKADRLSRWFEDEVEKEKSRIERWSKAVTHREKKVASAKRAIKKTQEKQDERGLWLMDREEMMSRTMEEIRRKERAILAHGRRKTQTRRRS